MVIAIVSEESLFPSGSSEKEEAGSLIGKLEQRLSEMDGLADGSQIAISQLLFSVE